MDETGAKITALDALTDGASDDLLAIVDVSDNDVGAGAMSADGTNKKMTLANLVTTLQALGLKTPAGVITAYGGATAPTGYLLCDGSAVSRTTYADLFTAIGDTYGAGDGSTTFNLPDPSGRVLVGLDSADTSFDALGETGGAKTHTLTEAEMPSHLHSYNRPSVAAVGRASGSESTYSTSSVGANTGSTGGGSAHNNLQPYMVFNFIIKT